MIIGSRPSSPCAGIAGGIVGVGMLTLLLWKAFTTVTDRREFARLHPLLYHSYFAPLYPLHFLIIIQCCRFEAERQKMKWNSNANPIFRQATTTIQNPMYCKDAS